MKKGKLSRDVIRAKDRDKKQDTAFRIRLGKDDAGMQILEIRSGERTAIIAATDLLPPLKQVSEKLLAQGMPVLQRQRLEALQSAAQRALERQKPAFTLVSRPGWVEEKAFVHGQRLVGSLPKNRVFRSPGIDLGDRPAKFSARGSLEEWQELVRRVARDEPLVTFLLCVAFASMILHLLKVQPFAILLHAKSSVGKSYLGKFVASVAGGDPCSPETGFAESFKATDVGLEKLFLAHNNLVLVLNELSRVPAEKRLSVLEAMVNDLCAGTPKTRGTDSKGALRYSTCGIITSNESYSELLAKANREPAEAMRPRLLELCADMGAGFGVFTKVPREFESSSEAIKAMRDAADRTYGWPARIFAKKICEHKAEGSTVVADVIAKWERFFSKRLGIDLTGVEGQVRDKVAAAGAVGMLAKRLGVLPKEINIIPAIDWAWAAIAKQQPKVNASPVEAVAAYIRENKTRFSKTPLPSKYDEADAMALAGIVHEGENDVEFLIPKPAFNAAFGSLGGSKAVMPSLAREGLAVVENLRGRKFQMKRQVGRKLRVRLYVIKAKILDRA